MTPAFPLVGIGMGTGNEEGINLASFLSQNPSLEKAGGNVEKAGKIIGGALGKAYDSVTKNSFLGLLFGSDYRYLTGIIGLLLIIAGIFLFREVRETVVSVSKTAAKVAATTA